MFFKSKSEAGGSERESEVLEALKQVIDPDLHKNIVELGFVKELKIEGEEVSFNLELTTPACPVKDDLKQQCVDLILNLSWANKAEVNLTAQPRVNPLAEKAQETMRGVKSIIAVSSCKGGVGKSMVSANLAVALSQQGAKVGLLDADIYGPSLPTMLGLEGRQPIVQNQKFVPLEAAGLKVMSAGFLFPSGDAAVLRGPMVSNILQQVLLLTMWGELDYLILDMPPGTGDIQLTITQAVSLSGAVIVTTPQKIALIDVGKGIDMFGKVNVPILGVVENMSYLMQNNQKMFLYGQSGVPFLTETYGLDSLAEIPFFPDVVQMSDRGRPAAADVGTPHADAFDQLAKKVVRQNAIIQGSTHQIPNVDITW